MCGSFPWKYGTLPKLLPSCSQRVVNRGITIVQLFLRLILLKTLQNQLSSLLNLTVFVYNEFSWVNSWMQQERSDIWIRFETFSLQWWNIQCMTHIQLLCPQVQIWEKNGPEIVSARNLFNIWRCVICVMTLDLMQISERWFNDQIFKMDLQFWAVWPG